jgi:ATP/maltotriose-dependent transcriptional regulator MalT/two-component SAPR family response regulator
MPVTWYGVEADDADPSVFLAGLATSVSSLFHGVRWPQLKVQDGSPSGLIAMASELLETIENQVPEVFVTVIDDYHLIDAQDDISALVEFILRHMPENWRLILTGRHTPRLRLIKLIAGGAVSGVGKGELAFTRDEVADMLQSNGLDAQPELVDQIHQTTDGWPVAVALIVRSLKGDLHSLSLFQTLGKQALEFLIWDLLGQIPDWHQQLLEAAVFDELGPDELAACAGADKAADFATLVSELPMVSEVAHGRFVMHDMLRSTLLTRLREHTPLRYIQAHRRAAQMYRAKLPEAAVRHFIEARLFADAAQLLDSLAAAMFRAGRWRTIAELGNKLPESEVMSRPTLSLTLAKALDQLGRGPQAVQLFSQIAEFAEAKGQTAIVAEALAELSTAHRLNGLLHRAQQDAERALELAPAGSAIRAAALRNLGIVLGQLGKPEAAEKFLELAQSAYSALGDRYCVALCLTDLANLYLAYRRLPEARAAFSRAMALWSELENDGNLALALNGAGVAANLSGDWTSAETLLLEGLQRSRKAGYARAEAYSLASLADLRMDQGQFHIAVELFHEAYRVATEAGEGYITVYALDGLARAARASGQLQEAAQWNSRAFHLSAELHMAQEEAASQITAALIQAELGNLEAATNGLGNVLQESHHLLDLRRLCLARVLQACLHLQMGRLEDALTILKELVLEGGSGLLPSAELRFAAPLFEVADSSSLIPGLTLNVAALMRSSEPSAAPEGPKPRQIRVNMLGPVVVMVDGTEVTDWEATSARDLFLYLVHSRRPQRRETLMELFWPEQPPGKAASALQSALYRVRRVLGKEVVRHHQGWYSIEAQIHTDVEDFRNLIKLAEEAEDREKVKGFLNAALTLYRGDYLESLYSGWPEAEREEIRELKWDALRRLAILHYEDGDYPRAIALCRKAIAQDPYREAIHRILMRALARSGDRAGALQHYYELQELLRRDLATQPEPSTRLVFENISRGEL